MDVFSQIFDWLSDREAGISAIAAIIVIGGVVLAGLRLLVRRRTGAAPEKTPTSTAEPASVAEAPAPDLDPLTVPGFEGRPAIAVLPFDNLSDDPEQEYFADGIAEDLITRLSARRRFPVIARNSSFTYKGKAVDVKQVSRELGVRYVVEGSVRKSASRVRITAQVIDATTGHHIWAETYDRELQDIFAVQDEITQMITASMGSQLWRSESERAARKPSRNLETWDYLLRAYWHFNKFNKEGNTKARSLYQKVTELDPDSALGFCGLAATHINDAVLQWTDAPNESVAASVEAAQRAVTIDSEEALSHLFLGIASELTGQAKKAVAALQRAIELDPSLPAAHAELGAVQAMAGRPNQGIAEIEKAIRLSPHDPYMWMFLAVLGLAHFAAARYEEAVVWSERALQGKADYLPTLWTLASSLAHAGRLDDARSVCREMSRLNFEVSFATIRLAFSFAGREPLERLLDGLRKAGMKE
jgi:adenylate cyclase